MIERYVQRLLPSRDTFSILHFRSLFIVPLDDTYSCHPVLISQFAVHVSNAHPRLPTFGLQLNDSADNARSPYLSLMMYFPSNFNHSPAVAYNRPSLSPVQDPASVKLPS